VGRDGRRGLLAAADRSDPADKSCRDLLESHPRPLITTDLVLAEAGWLLDRQLGPRPKGRHGELVVEQLRGETVRKPPAT
jgi:hypothetical protein